LQEFWLQKLTIVAISLGNWGSPDEPNRLCRQ
jgi:hypothetical protein